MNIDITRLRSGLETSIPLEEQVCIDVSTTEIIELKDCMLKGSITKDREGYQIDAILTGIMVLPSSITLKPVDVPFETEILGNIEEMLLEIGKIDKKIENSIDIFPILWENILMEIPMKVVDSDANVTTLKGDGWQFVTENELERPNPELEKLKDLLK